MRLLLRAEQMPIGLPAAQWVLEFGAFVMSTETELIIKSRRAIPTRQVAKGLDFDHTTMESAVPDLESNRFKQRSAG